MKPFFVLLAAGLLLAGAGNTQAAQAQAAAQETWQFKHEFLPVLVQAVPGLLKGQDWASGRFGKGIWIPADQNVIYPLAAAWALPGSNNPCYHDPKLLEAIARGGDALIQAQDKTGQWEFRKKDNSTWGLHYDPWVYSRWVRTYSLVSSALAPERRARWQQALELGFSGIAKHALHRVHNIPSHHAMGLYVAGKALQHPEWCAQAAAFLSRVAAAQDPNGFWSEHFGPVVLYNSVYIDALGTYYSLSHDPRVLPALERAARFHANFTYPDGSNIETIDERNPYSKRSRLPGVSFSLCAEGRAYLRQQWNRLPPAERAQDLDTLASLLLYGEEGPTAAPPDLDGDATFIMEDGKASVLRKGPWCACLSAYVCPVYASRWIEDRQNLVSLFHEKTGLILGGGNTKLQPLWSTFTAGDTRLLHHRPGDQNPDFSVPAGLAHVPSRAALEKDGHRLALEYGPATCSVALELCGPDKARLTYAAKSAAHTSPVEAHLTLLPAMGQGWRTASGKTGRLDAKPFTLTRAQAGAWFEHNGWRVTLPPDSSLTWPVLPHNPYRKDGRAEPGEGRIVLTLPFSAEVNRQEVEVSVAGVPL